MLKSIFLSLVVLFTVQSQAKTCSELDTLFEAKESFICDSEEGDKVCINFGYHPTVELDGMRIMTVQNDAIVEDRMIFHEPVWHNCVLSVFKACTNQYVKETGYGYKAYRKRAPDVWDARSSEVNFKIYVEDGYAEVRVRGYNVQGKLTSDNKIPYRNCVLQN